MENVRVALAQLKCTVGDVVQNVKKACDFIVEAKKNNADIICFPEMFATGYDLSLSSTELRKMCADAQKYVDEMISGVAKREKIWVIAPYGIVENQFIYNAAVLYNRSGEIVGIQRKGFSFERECELFDKGEQFSIFETEFAKIGILICYDVGFPETSRKLSLSGAEIVFVPSAWCKRDLHAWQLNIPSRALENQLFTVGVNQTGRDNQVNFFGGSMACDPWGKIIFQMNFDLEELGFVDLNKQEIMNCRAAGGYLKDFRAI